MATPQDTDSRSEAGPVSYENWIAEEKGIPSIAAVEFPLFTDAYIVGEARSGFGPYQILNTVPIAKTQAFVPALVLRVEYHMLDDPYALHRKEKTDVQRYHGGLLSDEVAALLSLCLGIRLKAGGRTRDFHLNDDPRGRPTATEMYRDPVAPIPTTRAAVLPRALGEHQLEDAATLIHLPRIPASGALALVRTARLYQDAVWIAEAEPHLSWVMLVSAVETAAGHWRTAKESPIDRLRASQPNLEPLLQKAGGDDLLRQVAQQIADYMGATKKFIDFILEFLPEPPTDRPAEGFQHPWDRDAMLESLRIIYNWRSRALHGGTPFPFPMCEPPYQINNSYAEKPIGLATRALGAYWVVKDTPMLLHTFEYIVRNATLKWWVSMTND